MKMLFPWKVGAFSITSRIMTIAMINTTSNLNSLVIVSSSDFMDDSSVFNYLNIDEAFVGLEEVSYNV